MITGKELLTSIIKTTLKSQTGIRTALKLSMGPALRKALESQLREYDVIESEAHFIACQRGWELREPDPAVRFFSDRMTRVRLPRSSCDSKIADRMIRDITKGMILGFKNLHRYPMQDDRISGICQKLLDCETAGIRQMQVFL